ncbi:MAG: DUF6146 family protein [Flavobacteriaceae bacterium]|nr:hypothetical protein [Flavobacteriaceae bacterium]
MKYFILTLITIIGFASCKSGYSSSKEKQNVSVSDTLRIKNDSLEYEIMIIEPGFNSWLVTQPPQGYYGQPFLESRNQQFVQQYNYRVHNPMQFDPSLYQQEINYSFNIDYGYEVNYLLYNYFVYFQQKYNQQFIGGRKRY